MGDFDLGAAWRETEALLPAGWRMDGLRCASTGLRLEDRSEEWIAVAVDGSGAEVHHRASSADAALRGLPARVRTEART